MTISTVLAGYACFAVGAFLGAVVMAVVTWGRQ